ncbi:hypothetical protein F7D20_07960 [Prevotella copri]|uniref:Uncharacterized protein n=1 Tax=Segatella copri TaxID=165179 RepID=A0A6A7WC07_9BACT|nr:hypothetical protein [Segatella copri]MQP11888.1 hypothetical protein [Segatella copri]
MRFEYICHHCNNRFITVLNATKERVACPYCQQIMTASNINVVVDDSVNQVRNQQPVINQPQQARVQARPVQGRPVQARPVQARPVQARPVQARPIQAQPVQTQPIQAQPVQAQPVQTQPVQTQPIQAQPVPVQPVQAEALDPIVLAPHAEPAAMVNDMDKPDESNVEPSNIDEAKPENSAEEVSNSESEKASLQESFNKALLESVEEDEEDDENVEIADELKEAMNDTYEGVSKKKFNPVLMIVLVVAAVLFTGIYFLFIKKDKQAEKTEMLVKNEKAAVQALKEFSQDNPDMNITQYFMLDLDQDGQKEVIANNDKNLIVFGAEDGAASLIYKKPVFEWVYLRGKGLFVVNTDESQKKGSAVWLIKAKYTLVEEAHQENYHFSNGAYTKLLNGKETKVSEDDYYGFVNTIIKNYTKLTPLKL